MTEVKHKLATKMANEAFTTIDMAETIRSSQSLVGGMLPVDIKRSPYTSGTNYEASDSASTRRHL